MNFHVMFLPDAKSCISLEVHSFQLSFSFLLELLKVKTSSEYTILGVHCLTTNRLKVMRKSLVVGLDTSSRLNALVGARGVRRIYISDKSSRTNRGPAKSNPTTSEELPSVILLGGRRAGVTLAGFALYRREIRHE